MIIVKFKDGKFGLRKGKLFYKYYDLKGTGFTVWRSLHDSYFGDCKGDLKQIEKAIDNMNDYGIPVCRCSLGIK